MTTVQDLINKLSTFDPGMEVWHISTGGVYDEVGVDYITIDTFPADYPVVVLA